MAVSFKGVVRRVLTVKAIRGKVTPWWCAAILYLLTVPTMVSTVRAANHVPPQLASPQKNAVHAARLILGCHD